MCGRISRTSPRDAIANEFGVTRFAEVRWEPRYNVAPSQIVETIISVDGEKRLEPMRWGFVSPAAKEPKLAPINARAEALSTSPMFRDAFRRRRCLVVADGSYEWRKNNGRRRTPFCIRLRSGRPFGFAGTGPCGMVRREPAWPRAPWREGLRRYAEAHEAVDTFEREVQNRLVAVLEEKTNWHNFKAKRLHRQVR